ncbi:MAG: GNAT family N-acetyltransferase [Anaerolineae bacterium]|nr:GNAT family N-acetyltransferase [Anaerolineae bacterium]
MPATASAQVTLQEITEETLRPILRLEVADNQKHFVATNAVSIAQAHFSKNAWFRAIYADETPVGFVMLYIDEEKPEYFVWRFMIDKSHQGKGYGRQALLKVIDHVRGLPDAKELFLSYVPKEGSPLPFYRKLGFEETGEWDEGEKIMKLIL